MITKKTKVWQYFSHLFISVDQFGNALAGGNSDNTISARVGYYNNHKYEKGEVPWYWSLYEKIIDTTFRPVDGDGHCHEAYHNDAGEIFENRITNFMVFIAGSIIIPCCIVIFFVLYILTSFKIIKRKTIKREQNLVKRFNACKLSLISISQEINEHGLDFDLDNSRQEFKEILLSIEKISHDLNM